MKMTSLLKPNVLSFGFAVILSINTTSVWGGVFPFFPQDAQTTLSTVVFYLVQLSSTLATYLACMLITWKRPRCIERMNILVPSVPLSVGSLLLVGAMYVHELFALFVVLAAVFIGSGSSIYLIAWQRVFAAKKEGEGSLAIVIGTGYSAVLYFVICLIPAALTAYIIPLVMVPLAGLCLWIACDKTDNDQPMFEDVPIEHTTVYRNALKENISPALCAGALGFSMGAMRFVAITHQDLANIVNIISMATLLLGVLLFLPIWRSRSMRFELAGIYRVLFPLVGAGMLLFPFAGANLTMLGIAITYTTSMLVNIVIMMHCCQVSRSSGINPLIMFAFYECIVYILQIAGYAVGYASGIDHGFNVGQLSFVALAALFVLLITSVVNGGGKKLHTNRLEFLMLASKKTSEEISKEMAVSQSLARQQAQEGKSGSEEALVKDRISKQCQIVKERFELSAREAEVMELAARGQTGTAIAEQLFISENTVRTHLKRIYAKLDVHRKREMIAVIENVDD